MWSKRRKINVDVFVLVLKPVYNLFTFQLLFHPVWFIKDLAPSFRAAAVPFGLCAAWLMRATLEQKMPNFLGPQVAAA